MQLSPSQLLISVVERAKVYLCNSNFWILLAVFSSNSMLSWGVVTWLPTYLNTERGFSWANVGWMSALPFIFGLLFKVLAGFIVDKTDRKGMVMFVSAMLCAASILTGVNISNNFFAAIVISFGIGASSMQLPCVFTLLHIQVEEAGMQQLFGRQWEEYCNNTPRWFSLASLYAVIKGRAK
ncbi:MFS transporter [Klebsiella pneumoniae]|uniref:MFS transporter n=1 Tax=Klebsiella pneumoniae TaxID=573 RepID=UPI00211D8B6F|nr:MFS transporter [Klebsiella pneumoniae]MCQ9467949.1 MFS transporter [Klebsiella pneumoniae]